MWHRGIGKRKFHFLWVEVVQRLLISEVGAGKGGAAVQRGETVTGTGWKLPWDVGP